MKTGQFVVFVKNAEILRRQTDLFNCMFKTLLVPKVWSLYKLKIVFWIFDEKWMISLKLGFVRTCYYNRAVKTYDPVSY